MRGYIYLFVVGTLGVLFAGVLFQAPDPGAAARDAFLGVCEGSETVRAATRSVDRAAMICTCIAAWHLKRAPAGTEPFYPTQLYILTGAAAGTGLGEATIVTDAKARAACLK